MSLPNVAAAIILITGLTLACGGAQETPAATEQPRAAAVQPTAPAAQSSQAAAETTAPAATEPAEEENQGPQPPPKDELIKFANWDDNPVKLVNWIAAYIIAHGLDRPIRVIDVGEPGEYRGWHIAGAESLPLRKLREKGAELMGEHSLCFVSRMGRRAQLAVTIMQDLGHQRSFSLRGGMLGWEAAGYPIAVE